MAARKPHLQGLSQHAAISRVLAGLLLVFVIYGTTIAAAHRHGRILSASSNATSASQNQETQDVFAGSSSCSECLICQLQQHFSNSLITVRDETAPNRAVTLEFNSAAGAFITRSHAPSQGRAPPLTS